MKKNLFLPAVLCLMGTVHAQIRTANAATNVSVSNSPAFIDASSNTTVNGSTNIGKGLLFPRMDLSAMTAFPGVTAGIANSFPTRFDGMIVYNTAASGTAGIGATSGTLSPGFWYYENKSSTNTGGTWRALGGTLSGGDNLGDHSATKNLALNDYELRLRGISDNNQSLMYNAAVNGPRLFGAGGGYLGTSNGINALTWDSNGNILSPGQIRSGISGAGFVMLQPGDTTHAGHIIFNRADNTRVGFIGYDNTNMSYYADTGYHIFNKSVQTGSGVGNLLLASTDSSHTGHIQFRRADNSRIGYIGYDNFHLTYVAENGSMHIFNTTIVAPRVQGPSDQRFKKDITPIYKATEKLNQLNGYTYTWKDKKEFPGQTLGEGKDMGVIAQEVEKVFPDAVQTNKDGYKSVNYNALIPVLIEALKESNKKIKALEDRLDHPENPGQSQESRRASAN